MPHQVADLSGVIMMKRQIRCVLIAIAIAGSLANGSAHAESYSADKAMQYFQARNWNALLPYLDNWTKASPNDPMPWYYMGTSYGSKSQGIGMGRPEDARIAFKKAVAIKPNFPKAWNALGWTEIELENYPGAATAFEQATKYAPTNAQYRNSLGTTLAKLNRIGEATAAYNKAAKLGSPDAANNNKILHTPVVSQPLFTPLGNGSNSRRSLTNPYGVDYNYYHQLDHNGAPLQK